MTRPHARPLLLTAILAALLLLPLSGAAAGPDDFEFGQALAQRKYFDLARKVYEGMLADANTSDQDKDAARYGIALLTKSQAEGATATNAPYPEIKGLFDKAVQEVAEFVAKNPSHPRAEDAKLAIGTIRLAFTTWCEELLNDPKEIADHGADVEVVRIDARQAVDAAIEYFGRLKPADADPNPSRLAQLARYNWVVCQYYRGLVQDPRSPEAMSAFTTAAAVLEDYVTDNDGFLVAIYAQDILGLVNWRMAGLETDAKKQEEYYGKALIWFDTCIETENQGDEYLTVITNGYYHLGQMALEAGKTQRRFWREAVDRISRMLQKHPTAWRKDNGLRALVEWSKIECARGDAQKAIDIARDAANRAKTDRKPWIERLAGRQLNEYVSGGCGGGAGAGTPTSDPTVLQRVADDLFLQKKYPEAIRAYRAVIASIPDTPQAFVEMGIPAWRRIGASYRALGDVLGAALALDPVHDAWMDGRIPRKEGEPTDRNLGLAGDVRWEAQMAFDELAKATGSPIFKQKAVEIRNAFGTEYPRHPRTETTDWNTALDFFRQAVDARKRGDPSAAAKFAEARKNFRPVAQNPNAPTVDKAWEYLVWADVIEGKHQDAVATAKEAESWFSSPTAKAQEEKFPDVRGRREPSRARVQYWKAEAHKGLGQWDQVLATLKDFSSVAGETFPQRALALQVEAHLDGKRMAEADALWQRLVALDPKWDGLGNVARRFAAYYTAQYKDIEAEYKKVETELRGKDGINRRLARAQKAANDASNAAVDRTNRLAYLERMIRFYEDDPKEHGGVSKGDYENAKKEIPELKKQIAADQEVVRKSEAERVALEAQKTERDARRDELRKSLYGPLTSAARYYKQWDDALKATGAERDPSDIVTFAYMFYYAASLDPTAAENWGNARQLYEDYLAHPKVKDVPPTDPKKRGAVAKLGDIYVHFAEGEKNAEARRALVGKAVDFLQNAIASRPDNNELVVALLTGDVIALPWDDPVLQRKLRIPVRRAKDVAAFKAAVQSLGKPEGSALPRLANERDQRAYLEAVDRFKAFVARESDARLKLAVDSMVNAGVDWALYKDLADTSSDFRLALAWSYSESGRPEDLMKGLQLSESLVAGPLAVDEETTEWWSAYTLRLKSYLAAAEAAGSGGGAPSGTTGQWLDRAKTLLKSVANTYPDLGDASRPGTRQEWQALLQRLNGLCTRNNLQPLALDLSRKALLPEGGAK